MTQIITYLIILRTFGHW